MFLFCLFFSPLPANLSSSCFHLIEGLGSSWLWPYGSWIYKYLCNQRLSQLLDKTLCDKVCQWLATGRWFSPGSPVSSTNKTDRHDIAEILLKVTLNTINQTIINWGTGLAIMLFTVYLNPCTYAYYEIESVRIVDIMNVVI